MDDGKAPEGLISRFPFVMVLTTTFLRGILFVFLNLPLISPVIQLKTYPTLADLLLSVHLVFAKSIASYIDSVGSLLLIFLVFTMSLGIGIILEPVERGIAHVLVLPLNCYISRRKKTKRNREPRFFSSSMMLSSDYSRLLEWFFTHTIQRSHWEWELFHYYVNWGVLLNLAIFSGSSIYLLRNSIKLNELMLIIVGNLAFLIFTLLRSQVMANVHSLYINRSRRAYRKR